MRTDPGFRKDERMTAGDCRRKGQTTMTATAIDRIEQRTRAKRREWLGKLDSLLGIDLDDDGIDDVVELCAKLGLPTTADGIARMQSDRSAAESVRTIDASLPSAVAASAEARDVLRALGEKLGRERAAIDEKVANLHRSPEGIEANRAAAHVADLQGQRKAAEQGANRWASLMRDGG